MVKIAGVKPYAINLATLGVWKVLDCSYVSNKYVESLEDCLIKIEVSVN